MNESRAMDRMVWPSEAVPIASLATATPDQLDSYDVGIIKLDASGRVLAYNSAEEKTTGRTKAEAIGADYFNDLAPCTQVPQFEGRFKTGVARGDLNEHFLFDFDFKFSPATQVAVSLCATPADQDTQTQATNGDHVFWILTRVVHQYAILRDDKKLITKALEAAASEPDILANALAPADYVQPWSALLVVEPSTQKIIGASENTHILRPPFETVLGKNLDQLFDAKLMDRLKRLPVRLAKHTTAGTLVRTRIKGNDEAIDVRCLHQSGYWYLECMVADFEHDDSSTSELFTLYEINDALEESSLDEICSALVQNIARISGFARVSLFRFDTSWNSQVTHEARHGDALPSQQDLYFPESDFPAHVRTQLTESNAQFVPVRDHAPIKVRYLRGYQRKSHAEQAHKLNQGAADSTATISDQSSPQTDAHDYRGLHMASTSPMQRLQLRAQNVNGSMILSIIVSGSLWGVVQGHHPLPHHLNQAQKLLIQMTVQKASTRIENRLMLDVETRREQTRGVHLALVEALNAAENVVEATLSRDNFSLIDLYESQSAGVYMEGSLYMRGEAPPSDLVKMLLKMAADRAQDGLWHSDQLGHYLPDLAPYQRLASGAIIAFPSKSESYALIWLFPERVLLRGWAGNPSHVRSVTTSGGVTLALPRPTYDRWTEVTCGHSRHITREMLDMAEEVRQAMGDFLLKRSARLLRMSADLNAANARMSALIDNMPEAVIGLFDLETVISFNRGAEQMFDSRAREKIGFPVDHLFTKESWTLLRRRIYGDTSGNNIQVDCLRDTGDTFPADVSFGTWTVDAKKMLVMVLRDRTEAVQFEALAQQRTKTEALGQFAGSVAHDFNNFLSIISANIDLADLTDDAEGRANRLDAARHAVRRGAELTDRLLSLVRRRKSPVKLLELNSLLQENEALFQATLGSHVTLVLSLERVPIYINLEPGQIENTLINLLNNARDAIESDGEVHIITRREKRDGEPLFCLEVADTGSGMDAETKARATEPFFSTKPPGKGTGIGLITLTDLATNLHGFVELDSEPGLGTSFKILFPPTAARNQQIGEEETSEEGDLGKETASILVVEDEDDVREPIMSLLKHKGFHVTDAVSFETAKKQLDQSGPVDILLTDINLIGNKTGLDIGQYVADKGLAGTVLYMTGDAGALDQMLDDQSRPVLPKPFRLSSFLRLWREEQERTEP